MLEGIVLEDGGQAGTDVWAVAQFFQLRHGDFVAVWTLAMADQLGIAFDKCFFAPGTNDSRRLYMFDVGRLIHTTKLAGI